MDEPAKPKAPDGAKAISCNDTRREVAVPEAAFDEWLRRSLHALYDDVAKEPVPEDLLRLIEQDRQK